MRLSLEALKQKNTTLAEAAKASIQGGATSDCCHCLNPANCPLTKGKGTN